MIKANLSGDIIWSYVYGYNDDASVTYSIQQSKDNGYITTGQTHHQGREFSHWKTLAVKFDSLGNTCLWKEAHPLNATIPVTKVVKVSTKVAKAKTIVEIPPLKILNVPLEKVSIINLYKKW